MKFNIFKVTNLLALLLFFYFLAAQQTLVWLVKGLTVFTLSLTVLGFVFIFRYIKPKQYLLQIRNHLYVLILLFVYFLVGYGDNEDLNDQIMLYLTALSFFNIGMIFGLLNKIKTLKKAFIGIYIISILNIFPYVLYCLSRSRIEKVAVVEFFGADIYAYITFWPLYLIVLMCGFAFTYSKIFGKSGGVIQWVVYTFLFIVFITSLVLSSFTAVLMMMFVIFIVFMTAIMSRDKIYKMVLLLPLMFGIISYGIIYLSESDGIVSEDTRLKLVALVDIFSSEKSDTEDSLDDATGSRWVLIEAYAIPSFNDEPFVGQGVYKYKDNVKITSGHSSIFDGFAVFGLFYFFFIALYVGNIIKAVKLFLRTKLKEKRVFNAIIAGASLSFFAISFFNPYLEMATIHIIFLLSGWVRGQLIYYKTHEYENSLD